VSGLFIVINMDILDLSRGLVKKGNFYIEESFEDSLEM
jgi:hypothetical protein